MLRGEIRTHEPNIVYIVDEGRPVLSREISTEYKANRQKLKDPDFWREKDEVFETIKRASGFTYIRHPHRECDDVIGHLASVTHKNDFVVIVSTDSDFIQLIDENVNLWHPQKKKYLEPWYCDYVTWKALRGDSTDNISGVRGVGPKRADALVSDVSFLESFLSEKTERRDQFETSYALIKLKDVPIEGLQVEQRRLSEKILFQGFQERNCKTIIGKAWPGWIEAFQKAGGKNGIQTKNVAKCPANEATP